MKATIGQLHQPDLNSSINLSFLSERAVCRTLSTVSSDDKCPASMLDTATEL